MSIDRNRLAISGDLDTSGVHTALHAVIDNPLFHPQKPYRNGVVVYAKSVWQGNGFGNDIVSDCEFTGHGAARRRVVTSTALSKWIAAVKGL